MPCLVTAVSKPSTPPGLASTARVPVGPGAERQQSAKVSRNDRRCHCRGTRLVVLIISVARPLFFAVQDAVELVGKLRRALGQSNERDRKIILLMAQKMALR